MRRIGTRSTAAGEDDMKKETGQVLSDTFSCAGSSVSSKSSRARLRLAELKKKHIEERFALEVKELQMKKELLSAEQEVERAKVEVELDAEEVVERAEPSIDEGRIGDFLQDCHRMSKDRIATGYNAPLDVPPSQSNDLATLMQSLVVGSNLPKVELMPFCGEPSEFWMFTRQFEYYVEQKIRDDGQRLLYLLHYCRGPAKNVIQECIVLPPEQGYRRARQLLEEQFGQPHRIARSLLDGLVDSLKPNICSAEDLTALANRMASCVITLTQMNYTADMDSLATIESVVKSLPRALQYQWAEYVDKLVGSNREPCFVDLSEFISKRARIARSRFGQLADTQTRQHRTHTQSKPVTPGSSSLVRRSVYVIEGENSPVCGLCSESHEISSCQGFQLLDVASRWDRVKLSKLCFKCLRPDHQVRMCPSPELCGVNRCRGQHHPLLHETVPSTKGNINHGISRKTEATVALGIVPIRILQKGEWLTTYALLDSGSDTTLVSADLANKLGHTGDSMTISIAGVSGTRSIKTRSIPITVCALNGGDGVQIDRAVCIDHIPVRPPDAQIVETARNWPHLLDVPLEVIPNGQVELLIGCDVPEAHWVLDQRLGNKKHPYAIKTPLGWLLLGPLSRDKMIMTSINCLQRSEPAIDEMLKRMYDAEFNDGDAELSVSVEDAKAVNLVQAETVLLEGHYFVPLPWSSAGPPTENNRSLAEKRAISLRRRLINDDAYCQAYVTEMEKNFERGHAVRVAENELTNECCTRFYLPHHGVTNPKKPGKLRVVFDCAAKFRGSSLNDYLLTGPDVTTELVSVLLRFRQFPIAIAVDIEEMFMQVKVLKSCAEISVVG